MSGVRLSVSLALAAVLALLAAPAALAGTFSYGQPASFTATAPGANPDHDAYGGLPWSYGDGSGRLAGFGAPAGIAGLIGWSDAGGGFVAVPGAAGSVTSGGDTFAPGRLALRAPAGESVALAFSSPLPRTTTFSVAGSVAPADPNCATPALTGGYNWSLVRGATVLASGSSAAGATIPATAVSLPSGGAVVLVVTSVSALLGYSADCATAEATLTLVAPGTAPTVAITSPASAAIDTPAQVTFAGQADSGYGSSKQVTVRVFAGTAATGTPMQTLQAPVVAGSWSVAPSAPLTDGLYTVLAEQDDLASPPDPGLSAPVSFRIATPTPSSTLVLDLPARGALSTATPTLAGTASGPGAGQPVTVLVYLGLGTTRQPVRYLNTTVGADGSFSAPVSPGLDDGVYTVVATQTLSGTPTVSAPVTLLIKVNPPTLTMVSPAPGGESAARAVFFGQAGAAAGDSATVELSLFEGASTAGRSLGKVAVTRSGGAWVYTWPRALKLGFYTVSASQSDLAGHLTTTTARTFLVVPSPAVIGSPVAVTQNGTGSVPIYCPARRGSSCSVTLSIVTVERLRVRHARGRLVLMRARTTIPGGATAIVRGHVPGADRRALLHSRGRTVVVTATLSSPGILAAKYTARRRASVAR